MRTSSPKVAKFNPAAIFKKSQSIQAITDPVLGLIRYKTLSFTEITELWKQYTDPAERSFQLLQRMLAPTNPGLTVLTIRMLPFDVTIRLLSHVQEMTTFLPPVTTPNKAFVGVGLPKGEIKP